MNYPKRVELEHSADMLCCIWEGLAIWPWLLYVADAAGNIEAERGALAVAAHIRMPVDVVERGLGSLIAEGFVRKTDRGYWVPVAEDPLARRGGQRHVRTYIIRRGELGPVKIGRSRDVPNRIASLQTACAERLHILHIIEDDREADLHAACAAHRTTGEWFDGSPEFFAVLRAALGED